MAKGNDMRKSNQEIIEAIAKYIKTSGKKQFYKTELRSVEIEPATAEHWFRLIEFIQQNIPPIKIIDMDRNFIIEVLGDTADEKKKED